MGYRKEKEKNYTVYMIFYLNGEEGNWASSKRNKNI